jgi:hypothetical protein
MRFPEMGRQHPAGECPEVCGDPEPLCRGFSAKHFCHRIVHDFDLSSVQPHFYQMGSKERLEILPAVYANSG